MSVFGSGTGRSSVLRKPAVAAALCGALLISAVGCGESSGVAKDAVVTAYVEASLCGAARGELRAQGGRAGDLRVRAVCLPNPHEGEKLDLATVGANARSATEDSAAIAYLEAPDPKRSRFTHPILETARIPWIASNSGHQAMSKLLKLIESAGSGSLREQLRTDLNQT